MTKDASNIIILAGANGAGKTTIAPQILKGTLAVTEFVNADTLAVGLSAFEPERAAITAGKIMINRLKELADQRVSFAFETTLASRMFAPWISSLLKTGYRFHLVYFWLPNEDMAVARVKNRVKMGGHFVPEETIRRRYHTGLKNFFSLYQPLTTSWRIYDSSTAEGICLIAHGQGTKTIKIFSKEIWENIFRRYANGQKRKN